VHVKTLRSQKLRMLLTHRKLLQSKAIAIENDLRGTLRNFGLKVGMVGSGKFEARIRELVENLPDLITLVEPLLVARQVLREQTAILHRRVLAIVRHDEVCRRLMTTPGVGPVVALTFRATIDVPARFSNSRAVGAVLGLTPCKYQSGESDYTGGISKCGDEMMRVMLYEAAQIMLTRSAKWSWLKAWAMQIARRRGMKKAIVALARRLAVIMHRIWVDGTTFRWAREEAAAA
jgi:transposase